MYANDTMQIFHLPAMRQLGGDTDEHRPDKCKEMATDQQMNHKCHQHRVYTELQIRAGVLLGLQI